MIFGVNSAEHKTVEITHYYLMHTIPRLPKSNISCKLFLLLLSLTFASCYQYNKVKNEINGILFLPLHLIPTAHT